MKEFAAVIIEIGARYERLEKELKTCTGLRESAYFDNKSLSEQITRLNKKAIELEKEISTLKDHLLSADKIILKLTDERDCERAAAKGWENRYTLLKIRQKQNLTNILAKGLKHKQHK